MFTPDTRPSMLRKAMRSLDLTRLLYPLLWLNTIRPSPLQYPVNMLVYQPRSLLLVACALCVLAAPNADAYCSNEAMHFEREGGNVNASNTCSECNTYIKCATAMGCTMYVK